MKGETFCTLTTFYTHGGCSSLGHFFGNWRPSSWPKDKYYCHGNQTAVFHLTTCLSPPFSPCYSQSPRIPPPGFCRAGSPMWKGSQLLAQLIDWSNKLLIQKALGQRSLKSIARLSLLPSLASSPCLLCYYAPFHSADHSSDLKQWGLQDPTVSSMSPLRSKCSCLHVLGINY